MPTIDPAGAASSALYTPAVPVQAPPQAAAVTERPVVENNEPEPDNDAVTQANNGDSNLGRFIDTTA
jgi:hypothetical protein